MARQPALPVVTERELDRRACLVELAGGVVRRADGRRIRVSHCAWGWPA